MKNKYARVNITVLLGVLIVSVGGSVGGTIGNIIIVIGGIAVVLGIVGVFKKPKAQTPPLSTPS